MSCMSQVIQFKLYSVGRTQIFSVVFYAHNMNSPSGASRQPAPISAHYYAEADNAERLYEAFEFMNLVLDNARGL